MAFCWISWVQPGHDVRPLNFPPNESVMGWWTTGYTENGQTLCAMVRAASWEEAHSVVLLDWPEAGAWRFCKHSSSPVLSDRFPLEDWMRERYAAMHIHDAGLVSRCSMCGYVGTLTDHIGQCPKCHWDELQPVKGGV